MELGRGKPGVSFGKVEQLGWYSHRFILYYLDYSIYVFAILFQYDNVVRVRYTVYILPIHLDSVKPKRKPRHVAGLWVPTDLH